MTAIFPRNDNMAVMPVINEINANLAKLADGKQVRYLNINDKLADKTASCTTGMMNAATSCTRRCRGTRSGPMR